MTKSTTVASKAFVAIVAAAMVFSLVAPAAKAATTEELQAQITALMAQIAALNTGAVIGTGADKVTSAYTFTRALTVGSTGADVTALQNYLLSKGYVISSATGYFGPQTKAAVAAWQTANGVAPAAGYFGPVSQAKYMALMAAIVPTEPTTPGTTPTTPTTLKGSASFDDATLDSADDDSVEEGQTDATIGEFTTSFIDGDASISRLDVMLSSVNSYRIFDTVSLWVDGKMIAEADASARGDYQNDKKTIRFNGLDITAMEGEDTVITVAATFKDGIDNSYFTSYNVDVTSMRYFDADGVADTIDPSVSPVSFTLEAAGANDEIVVKKSSNDPKATTLKLKDDAKSDWENVFTFDIDTKNSVNDIELTEVPVTVEVSSSTFDGLVAEYELVIDGTTVKNLADNNGATSGKYTNGTSTTITFDVDGDVIINAGDRVEAKLMLRFKSLASGDEGTTVRGLMTTANVNNIIALGADDLMNTSPDQLTGSATGDYHTVRTTGIDASLDSSSAVVTVNQNANDDYATFKVAVEVTAFDQDVFISTNPATSTTWSIVDAAGANATSGTRSVVLTSSGDENGGYFEINEGETETITLTVTYTPGVSNTAARLALGSLKFDDTATAPMQTWTALPATTYRTAVVTVVN